MKVHDYVRVLPLDDGVASIRIDRLHRKYTNPAICRLEILQLVEGTQQELFTCSE